MTATDTATIADMVAELPAPLTGLVPGAWIEYGRRKLSWGPITGPAQLYRNAYTMMWVDVKETRPWSGEPVLWAERRRDDSWSREGFTDAGRKAFGAAVCPVVARIGFERMWNAAHSGGRAGGADYATQAARHRAIAAWWDHKSILASLHAEGLVEFRPGAPTDDRGRSCTVLTSRDHANTERVSVAAYALIDGEHVGWLTDSADLIPLSGDLERRH